MSDTGDLVDKHRIIAIKMDNTVFDLYYKLLICKASKRIRRCVK